MSIKLKIILSFLVSFSIIILLSISAYVDFLEIKREIRYLELADSIRSKSLQLRRHEKNYFLYGDLKEADGVSNYLRQLKDLIRQGDFHNRSEPILQKLDKKLDEYRNTFEQIYKTASEFRNILISLKGRRFYDPILLNFVESTFLQNPFRAAELFKKTSSLSEDRAIRILHYLAQEIDTLRGLGEEILLISKDLDKSARERVESIINISQKSALILIPSAFFIGLILLFVISHGVVKRLRILMDTVEKIGKGYFSPIPVPVQHDEVSILIKTFNKMMEDLKQREEELKRKDEELFQSRNLAALGTLAAGVAHELNNPLNNIYISAQVLKREATNLPDFIIETVDDIMAQSIRVKHIISDLLEFARGREPQKREIDLKEVILGSYKSVSIARNTEGIIFNIEAPDEPIIILADPEQIERVFINLFNNAIDAMEGKGRLDVTILRDKQATTIKISDTGKGMPQEVLEKAFEPFYTTKERGTGLGLAIVYNIIKRHGWNISIESEEGRGTTFTITLERGRA